jgi:hypothetical protein
MAAWRHDLDDDALFGQIGRRPAARKRDPNAASKPGLAGRGVGPKILLQT